MIKSVCNIFTRIALIPLLTSVVFGQSIFSPKVSKYCKLYKGKQAQSENLQQLHNQRMMNALSDTSQELAIDHTQDGDWDSEIAAIINPQDSNNLVAFAMNPSGATLYSTRDFGKNWDQTLISDAADPTLAVDEDGTIYAVFLNGSPRNTFYEFTKDKGVTWITPSNDTVNSGNDESDKPWTAIDRSNSPYKNSLYVTLISTFNNQQFVILRKHRSSDSSFSPETVFISDAQFIIVQIPNIEVDTAGNIHVVFWGMQNGDSQTSIWQAISYDGGDSFTSPQKIESIYGNLYDLISRGTQIAIPGVTPASMNPQLVVDRKSKKHRGALYLVWQDIEEIRPKVYAANIYSSFSTDNGVTWNPRIRVNQDPDTGRRYHCYPSIAINDSGVVSIAWYDGHESSDNSKVNISVAQSFDGGKTFSKNYQASSEETNLTRLQQSFPFSIGDYSQTISSNGYSIPFWSDGRDSTHIDLYCALVPIGEQTSSVKPVIKINSSPSIYPNPISRRSVLHISGIDNANYYLDLYDILGYKIAALSVLDQKVNLSFQDVNSGTYVYRLHNENGMKLAEGKIIVK